MTEANESQRNEFDNNSNPKYMEELFSVLNYLVFDGACMKPESGEDPEHILKSQFDTHRNENVVIVSKDPCSRVSNWKPGKLSNCVKNKYPNATNQGKNSTSLISMFLDAEKPSVTATADVYKKFETPMKRAAETSDLFMDPKRLRPLGLSRKFLQQRQQRGNFYPPSKVESLPPSKCSTDTKVPDNNNYKNNLFTTPSIQNRVTHNQSDYINSNRRNEQILKVDTQDTNYSTPSHSSSIPSHSSSVPSHSSSVHSHSSSIPSQQTAFATAYEQLMIQDRAKGIKRTLPTTGSVPALLRRVNKDTNETSNTPQVQKKDAEDSNEVSDNPEVNELMKHELLKNVDPKMVEAILNEVVEVAQTTWDDIAGLDGVKNIIKEIIIWPMLRPDIFKGLRGPPKGILLFGPPGTGKTMIGRLISTESKSTFFNISASSLTSKWIGEGEKMVRALFQVARVKQPAVIFIDEIDSILTQRSETEHESSRRLKTEFLIQFDGCGTKSEDRILVIGVTNRPQELDEAARRRLGKRIYIPLPDLAGRRQLVLNLLKDQDYRLSEEDLENIGELTEGYSGADIRSICQEAAYGPIRDIGHMLQDITVEKVRPMMFKDFESALRHVKASVANSDLNIYEDWDDKFGCQVSQS